MIDLHCHILPSIDDGAQSLNDSIAMARQAEEDGIHTVVATPHHKNEKYENEKSRILAKVAVLNMQLHKHHIDVKVLPGQEIRIYGDLIDDYEKDLLLTMNNTGKYVFIEFPSSQVPRFANNLFYNMQMKGLVPIIVHPERNQRLIEKPDELLNFVDNGALTQITSSSITGKFGKKIQKFSFDLMEANLAHFIASDAHNTTTRPFSLNSAYERVTAKFGDEWSDILKTNAEHVVQGRLFYKEPPRPIKKKKIFSFLRG